MKTLIHTTLICMILFATAASFAQEQIARDTVKIDTVVIEVGKSSILFIIRDKKDLERLASYDLNKIVTDLQMELNPDSTQQVTVEASSLPPSDTTETDYDAIPFEGEYDHSDWGHEEWDESDDHEYSYSRPRGIQSYFNVDFGLNNFVSPDGFPDENNELYTVRPWGSWYIALGGMSESYIAKSMSLQFGANVSWYNFKFQNDATYAVPGDDEVFFVENPNGLDVNFQKSKLTVAYVNAFLVPMFHFGKKRYYDSWRVWNGGSNAGFRLGAGAYAGYRIGRYTKVKYNDGDRNIDKNHDSFYLNNFRYGIRAQIGFRHTDFFVNYDLNDLFREGKGPELNAFSFGIIF